MQNIRSLFSGRGVEFAADLAGAVSLMATLVLALHLMPA